MSGKQTYDAFKTKLVEALGASPARAFKVLHLDDEPDLLHTVSSLLADTGLDVVSTTDPDELFALAREHRRTVALILCDFKMPGANGFEVRQKLLSIAPTTPFVILSGAVDREMALTAVDLKIAAFLDKPFRPDDVGDVMVRILLPQLATLLEEAELLAGFLQDAGGLLEEAEATTLELERDPDQRALVNSLFGTMHTLKGAAGFFEPKTLHHYTHRVEDKLKNLQERSKSPAPAEVSAIFLALDQARRLLGDLAADRATASLDDLTTALNQSFGAAAAPAATGQAAPSADAARGGSPAAATAPKDNAVRVEAHVLDEFLKASGEITIIRNMLKRSAATLEKKLEGDVDALQLKDLIEELDKANALLQRRVSDVRKVSMSSVVKALPRIVRDVAGSLGKQAELKIEGGHHRIDMSVADVITKCIIHLIKNSLDHGLELPDRRRDLGKTPVGTLVVSTEANADLVTLKITDDGQGLNVERIRAKLLEKGFDPVAVGKMGPREIHQMIFAPGFSTAAQTTELSGRGVGMSMVEETVRAIGGTITIDSREGFGSTFCLTLPVPKSVLIKPCLFVRLGSERFGIDQDQVGTIINPGAGDSHRLRRVDGATLLVTDDQLLPVLSAHDLLKVDRPGGPPDSRMIVVLKPEKVAPFGIFVDEVLEFVDVVIKPLPRVLAGIDGYAGATFLEDRSIGLLVGADGLARRGGLTALANPRVEPAAAANAGAEARGELEWIEFEDVLGARRAIPLDQVLRIEQFNYADLGSSGDLKALIVGQQLVPIVDDESCASTRDISVDTRGGTDGRAVALIVAHGDRHLGLRVRAVVDIASAARDPHLPTNVVVNNRVLRIFDVERLRLNFARRLPSADVRPLVKAA